MKSTIENAKTPAALLKDPTLFRQAGYVNPAWVQAQSGETVDVDDLATERVIATVAYACVRGYTAVHTC